MLEIIFGDTYELLWVYQTELPDSSNHTLLSARNTTFLFKHHISNFVRGYMNSETPI